MSNVKVFLRGSMVKNSPAKQEMWIQSLDQEDPLEKEMATHSSILAWRILGQRSLEGYSPQGRRVRHNWATFTFLFDLPKLGFFSLLGEYKVSYSIANHTIQIFLNGHNTDQNYVNNIVFSSHSP